MALTGLASTVTAVGASAADAATSTSAPASTLAARYRAAEPIVIAHRGASGHRPEHTLAAYRLAIRMGADHIEPDLVSTKDGVLVARHENEIGGTTDVADHPEFADRRTTKTIDGRELTGWFTEDFTLSELRTLRARERLPAVRPLNTRYDGRLRVPTFDEVLELARRFGERRGTTIGVYPETKHPTYFDSIGLSLEEPLLATLEKHRLNRSNAPVYVQSFETSNLRKMSRGGFRVPLIQLVDAGGAPYDLVARGSSRTYADMVTPRGLAGIARYADGVGLAKDIVLPQDAENRVGEPSSVVDDAHDQGLVVHVWTLRRENQFMAANFQVGSDPDAPGDLVAETAAFLDAGVDGVFSDHPDGSVEGRDGWVDSRVAARG